MNLPKCPKCYSLRVRRQRKPHTLVFECETCAWIFTPTTLNHEDVLNSILSRCCGTFTDAQEKEHGFQRLHLEMHCQRVQIDARFLKLTSDNKFHYEILAVEFNQTTDDHEKLPDFLTHQLVKNTHDSS